MYYSLYSTPYICFVQYVIIYIRILNALLHSLPQTGAVPGDPDGERQALSAVSQGVSG